jgi:hypothetical protein
MHRTKAKILQQLCAIDDELKVMCHSSESVGILVLTNYKARNRLVDLTAGMVKSQRKQHFAIFFSIMD